MEVRRARFEPGLWPGPSVARAVRIAGSGRRRGTPKAMPKKPDMAGELVGVGRFELPASSSRTKRAAKLRHTPPARDLNRYRTRLG